MNANSKYLSDLASSLAGHAQCLSYDGVDGSLKRHLREASHALDSNSIRVHKKTDGLLLTNARGKSRLMTLRERIAYWMLRGHTEIRP